MTDPREPEVPNPYAAPSSLPVDDLPWAATTSVSGGQWALCFGRWLMVCMTCGATSFIYGLGVSNHPLEIPAMVLGIVIYAAVYTWLDVRHLGPRMARNRILRRAVIVGFGIRVLMSLIFPIGMMADMFPGIFAVSLAQLVTFSSPTPNDELNGVPGILAATLIQGALLNCFVWLTVLLAHGIQWVAGASNHNPWEQQDKKPCDLRVH